MTSKPHGNFTISVEGEILLVQVLDSWNEECSKEFISRYKKTILDNQFAQFGVLIDLRKLEGATPQAIQLFREVTEWTHRRGQTARAIIYSFGLKKFIIDLALNDDLFPVKEFENKKTAMAWFEQLGLKTR